MDSEILKALADENRLDIVKMLADGERCVCELASGLGLSDALVSHHVKRLRAAGVIRTRRVGQWLHCSLEPGTLGTLADGLRDLEVRASSATDGGCRCDGEKETA